MSRLLKEDGYALLKEDGDALLLEIHYAKTVHYIVRSFRKIASFTGRDIKDFTGRDMK